MFKSKLFLAIQYLFFIGASVWLINYCFHKVDINKFYSALALGNYWIAFIVFLFSILVYVSRITRWNIILKTVDEDISFMNNFSSVALCYLVSFFFPRGGEAVKCLVLNKTDDLSISKSISSTFFERLVDMICLLILIAILFILELINNSNLITQLVNPKSFLQGNKIWFLLALLILGVAIVYVIYKKYKAKFTWLFSFIDNLKKMVGLLANIKFTLHTVFIWLSYYLLTYLWFFVFDQTSNLTVFQAFQVMMVGTVARSIPLPAGALGAYHAAVVFALTYMKVDYDIAFSLAFIIHGFQTVFTFMCGLVAIFWLVVVKKIYRIK